MIVAPVDISLGYPTGGAPRTPGIHLSRVIRSLAKAKGKLDSWVASDLGLIEVEGEGGAWWDTLDDVARLRISMGLAWEQWYIPQLGDVVDHPGELCLNGIYMTHDGESLDVVLTPEGPQTVLAVHEIKLTYKSTKTVGEFQDQWLWEAQTMGYCKALGTRIAYVHVLFVCGNYKYPISPLLKCWRVEYDQAEIDTHWEEILGHVRLNRAVYQE